jgi:hemin uptake protein HemP
MDARRNAIRPRDISTGLSDRLSARPARIPSGMLLQGAQEVVIVHGGRDYRLRVSDDGGLVLEADSH